MSQQPHAPRPHDPRPADPRAHGGTPPPGAPPYAEHRPPRPPATPDLRLLLRLTVASFALAVLGGAVGFLTAPDQVAVMPVGPAFDTFLLVGSLVLGFGIAAGLYALVYFPLREQRQWAWVLGIVLASMALLSTLANAALLLVVPAGASPGLATGALKAVVDVAWLVVAVRPGVRAALR